MVETEAERQSQSAWAQSGWVIPLGISVAGGLATATASFVIPMGWLESLFASYGVSEIIPAAAPPLGTTARILIAIGLGVVAAAAILLVFPRKGIAPMATVLNRTTFMDRLRTLRHGRRSRSIHGIRELQDLPRIRQADAHPDAPTRKPISARSEFGTPDEPLSPLVQRKRVHDEADSYEKSEFLLEPAPESSPNPKPSPDTESRPAPIATGLAHEARQQHPAEVETGSRCESTFVPAEEPVMAPNAADDGSEQAAASAENDGAGDATPVAKPFNRLDLNSLTIAQLVDRLERGLTRLQEIDRPFLAPAPSDIPSADPNASENGFHASQDDPVAPDPAAAEDGYENDMDAALKAALSTLERMTANG